MNEQLGNEILKHRFKSGMLEDYMLKTQNYIFTSQFRFIMQINQEHKVFKNRHEHQICNNLLIVTA